MKRIISLLLSLCLLITLFGCSAKNNSTIIDSTTTYSTSSQTSSEIIEDSTETMTTKEAEASSKEESTKKEEQSKDKKDKDKKNKKSTSTSKPSVASSKQASTASSTSAHTTKATTTTTGASSIVTQITAGTTQATTSSTTTTTAVATTSTTQASQIECTVKIECSEILNNIDKLKPGHSSFVPSNGIILNTYKVKLDAGSNAYDALELACKNNGIKLSSTKSIYGAYVSGINNLDEKDCGDKSGWFYFVNDVKPNKSCSSYKLSNGDKVVWSYTCTY